MKVLTDNQYYGQIANVIREQNGTNNTYKPAQMVSALKDLFYEEVEGVPPITFNGIGENLLDYRIDGAIGGVGDRTKNFIQNTATTQTKNGVTFTVNEDKSISCNGTASGNAFFKIGDIQLKKNCIMSGCPEGGDHNSYIMRLYNNGSILKADSGDGVLINSEIQNGYAEIRIAAGYTCDNLTFYPMIRLAEIEDNTYEPYGYKVPVVVGGKNLFNGELLQGYYTDSTMSTLASQNSNYKSIKIYLKKGKYTLSSNINLLIVRFITSQVYQSNPAGSNLTKTFTFEVENDGYISLAFRNENNQTWDNSTNLQIEIGDTATTYEEYTSPTITTIYLDSLIYENESISLSDTNTNIQTVRGTNILTVDTTVQPSKVYVKARKESQYETIMRERYEEVQAQLDALESGGE